MANSKMIVVLTTVSNKEEGESLARKIVEARLAACVQVLPDMNSVYFWEGKIRSDSENLLLIKTLAKQFAGLSDFIKSNHSYDTPEIIALNASEVESSYLKWMTDYLS